MQWRVDEPGGDEQNDPEEGPAKDKDHAVALFPKMPCGNATSTTTNSANSIRGIQLTAMNGVTTPSSNPSSTPATRAPNGLPSPARMVTTKLFNWYTEPERMG